VSPLTARNRGVDPFGQADDRHPERLQLVEQADEARQTAPESIEPPTARTSILRRRAACTRVSSAGRRSLAADTPLLDAFDAGPAPGLDVSAEFLQLVLGAFAVGLFASTG
jgi:hypothetical protein